MNSPECVCTMKASADPISSRTRWRRASSRSPTIVSFAASKRSRAVLDVVQHPVGDHGIEAANRQVERLHIHLAEAEARVAAERGHGLPDHAGRKVREQNAPGRRNPDEVASPQPAGPAADLQNIGVSRDRLQHRVEH